MAHFFNGKRKENTTESEKKESFIQWMVKNIEHPMSFTSHDCENCWKLPADMIISGDSGVPFQLCNYCLGEYANLLPPDKKKRVLFMDDD